MYRRAWDEVTAVLHREYGIARSSEEPIDAFMQEGRLHVDLLPIPEHIWKELPVLLGWEHNLPYLTLTRDLSFTCRPIVPGSQGEIPLRHRINQVLYHIKRIGKSTPELLIVYLIEQHPYSYLAKMFRETNMHLIRLWQATITAAEISGLLARTGDGYLQITAQGERQLENALQRKGEIIRNGFDY
jgi:hypothetical protein